MTVAVPASMAALPGLEVTRDGERIEPPNWGRSLAVDPGAHTISAVAPGKKAWQQTVRSLDGGALEVTVPGLEDDAGSGGGAMSRQRVAGVAVGAVGLAGIALGGGLGLAAKAKWNQALSECQNQDPTRCSSQGIDHGNTAFSLSLGSTIGFVVGGAAVVAGIATFITAPSKTAPASGWEVVPAVGPGGVAAVVRGRF
jgi:hypothetical protein